ncbi:MAG: Ig-like domain-containing protein [Chryseolinea sp.]
MRRFTALHWFIYPLFLMCCAKTTSPTGGPKDTIPPVLIKSIPEKEALNYDRKEIQLIFSENITLKNQKEQIIVTPDIGKDYKIEFNKKTVTLKLKEKLKDSTTYTFSFRDAVVDLNEQNPARNLKLAFSTGNYIDSLSIEGRVADLLTSKELKDITVALFQSDTFDIFKHKAVYITKSDKTGKFIIENLKPGNYSIYAIDDKSRNLIVDSKSESYGFLRDSLSLSSNVKNLEVPVIKLDSRKLKISSARPYNTYFNIKTTKSIISYKIKSDELIPYSILGDDNASIKIYNTLFEKDSASLQLNLTDSIGNSIDTLLYVKFNKQNTKPEIFDFKSKDFRIIENRGLITGSFKFNKPLLQINFDSIFYKIDSIKIIKITKEDIRIDTIRGVAHLEKKIDKALLIKEQKVESKLKNTQIEKTPTKENVSLPKPIIENQLSISKASFISIESDSTKEIKETIKPTKLDQTGIIFVSIETKEKNFIVELLRKDFTVIQTRYNQNKITFDDLTPGDYMIRLIIDSDKNKIWTPGNFYLREEPEKLTFYKNEKQNAIINLRANFELGPLLIKY